MLVREIEHTRHVSHHTAEEVCDRAQVPGLRWDAARLLGKDEIARMLFPEEASRGLHRMDRLECFDSLCVLNWGWYRQPS